MKKVTRRTALKFFSGAASGSLLSTPLFAKPYLPAIISLLLDDETSLSWPRIRGLARPGEILTVESAGLSNVQNYQWSVDGVDVFGETGSSFIAPMSGQVSVTVISAQGEFTTPLVQILHSHGDHDHDNAENAEDAVLGLAKHVSATHIAVKNGSWSNPLTWDVGIVPDEGAVVLIPIDVDVTYDVSPSPRLDRLRIDGTLRAALDQSTQMLVETIIISHSGLFEIGSSFESRLPGAYDFELIISDRAYAISPSAPSNLDLVNDPFLMSRGIICLGNFVVFGDERKRHIKTANGRAPLAGNISITLAQTPENWVVGDEIVIPGTTVEVINEAATVFEERRTITGISGSVVSFAAPLIHDHDHHNSAVTRSDLQPAIANITTNVSVRSEAAAVPHRRGHIMVMHDGLSDVWDLGCIDLGRTDTTGMSGNVLMGGQFKYFDIVTNQVETITATASSNSKGRYPFHFHFCGFNRNVVPNLHNSVVDGSPGWGVVHHGCEAEIFDNVVFNWAGSGMVAETGNETGPWVRNFVFGCSGTSNIAIGHIKSTFGVRGLSGDFGLQGVAYLFRGRAIRTNDNIAASSTTGFGFYHRGYTDTARNITPQINVDRTNIDLKDLSGIISQDNIDNINVPDYPIAHFTSNEAFGVVFGFAVTKTDPKQGHDIMTQLKNFKAWSVDIGFGLEYVGRYGIVNPDLVCTRRPSRGWTRIGIWFADNTAQMLASQPTIEGFQEGIRCLGSENTNINLNNDQFDQANPRFMIDRANFINTDQDIFYEAEPEPSGTIINTTQDVTRIWTDAVPPSILSGPSLDLPFIVKNWNVGRFDISNITNIQTGTFTDSVSVSRLPKGWDPMMMIPKNGDTWAIETYALEHGYWTYGSDTILVYHQYHTDSLTQRPIRSAQAIRLIEDTSRADFTVAGRGYTYNGEWEVSANRPSRADMSAVVAKDGSVVINVLGAAIDPDGDTMALASTLYGSVFFAPASGRAQLDPAAGTVTYEPDFGFTGSDQMYVWVSSKGDYDTVKIDITVS